MKVCFLVTELLAWGSIGGGAGTITRTLATELAKRGIEVCVATPRRKGQKPVQYLDGFTVLSFPWLSIREQMNVYRTCDSDIYHHQDVSIRSWFAMKAMPDRKHVVTCRAPKDLHYWLTQLRSDLSEWRLRPIMAYICESTLLPARAIRKADAVFSAAKFTIPRAQKKYGLKSAPDLLSDPIRIPTSEISKSDRPTVCFVGSWVQRKRPEIFFELAREFPGVSFVAMGSAQTQRRDTHLRRKYGSIPNLQMTGFIDQFSNPARFQEILSKSWILINTSLREAHTVSCLEAASFKCAILSAQDLDGFPSAFGYWARHDDFAEGLRFLLSNDEWRKRGERAHEYVKRTNDLDTVVDKHIQAYTELVRGHTPRL